ncbi:DUF2784 domain-containing protein [Spirochaetota bacterium]
MKAAILSKTTLQFLDYFFLVFHTSFTLFNVFGWIWKKTRKAHFITLALTAFSWFVLGIWYGWGFCFCTDWHWYVRQMLGRPIKSWSYIHFLILEITGIDMNPDLVDRSTMAIFALSVIASFYFNFKDWKRTV